MKNNASILKVSKIEEAHTKRPLSFYIILILLPFILLALLEIILRLSHFGVDEALFIDSKQFKNYLQPNPEIIKRYFPPASPAPDVSPDTQYFRKIKSADSFRIVIQGGSTAAGFPFGRWASLKGMLDQRFKRLYPNKKIEIINTAMSAVNSYTLLDFVDEITALKPDLILIYAGHNEYLGIMGVGSAFAAKSGRLATLLSLKLKNFKLYQLLQYLLFSVQNQQKNDVSDRTLMSKIAKKKNIVFDSPLFKAGIEQFTDNLDLILAKYQQQQIPVMIATLVSNEKDQPPFASSASTNGHISAMDSYKKALKTLKSGNKIAARALFQMARDNDTLRFRAPTIFNQVIRKEAKAHQAIVVEVEEKFIQHSTDRIPGSALILEHLHPNLKGYFYLAEAFFDSMLTNQLLPAVTINYSGDKALNDIPVSKSDRAFGLYKIKKLKSGYPFTSKPYVVKLPQDHSLETIALKKRLKGESWLSLQQQLLVQYQKQGDFAEAAKIAALLTDAIPQQHQTAYIAGQLYFKINDLDMAQYYHLRAVSISPENINYLLSLAQDYFALRNYSMSKNTLQKILLIDPENKAALFYSQQISNAQKGISP